MPIVGGGGLPATVGDIDAAFGDADGLTPDGQTITSRLQALAPDGSLDRLRTLGNVAQDGLGQLSISPAVPGAGVVTSLLLKTVTDSTTRVTMVTPGSGLRVRIISVNWRSNDTIAHESEVYFGTGANIDTTVGNAIWEEFADVDTDHPGSQVWPDGAGPVGAVDVVVSIRTSVNVTGSDKCIIHYREE